MKKIQKREDPKIQQRMIIIILTQVRSGSSLTGSLLETLPGTFYTKEPIIAFQNRTYASVKSAAQVEAGKEFLRSLIMCNISLYEHYVLQRKHFPIETRNEYCFPPDAEKIGISPRVCNSGEFLDLMCLRSTIHLIKIVGFRLRDIKFLLEDASLDVKIIHLVRDPRGILASGKSMSMWKIFTDAEHFCTNMRYDIAAASEVTLLFTDK